MKQVVQLAVAVVVVFTGLVVVREVDRVEDTPKHVRVTTSKMTTKITTISTGESVEIDAHLNASGWTIVEFTADW